MHFAKVFASAVALCASVSTAALTAVEVTSNINILTAKSKALQAPANTISLINGPLVVVGLGPFPQIIVGFGDIVRTVTADLAVMKGTPAFTVEKDEQAITDAFREFVKIHQELLNILIGKAGLFTTVPFIGEPVAFILRQLESIVDTVVLSLIDMVDGATFKASITADGKSLGGTVKTTITTYEGLSL